MCANWAVGRGHLAKQAKMAYLHLEGEERQRTSKVSAGVRLGDALEAFGKLNRVTLSGAVDASAPRRMRLLVSPK